MRPSIGRRITSGLRWLHKRYHSTDRAEQPGRPPSGTWSVEPRRHPRRYIPDTVELAGPGVTELVRYVVDHLALVDGEAFEEYAHAACIVEDANVHGSATAAELAARDAAWRNLAVELPVSIRVLMSDVPKITVLLADAATPADQYQEAA